MTKKSRKDAADVDVRLSSASREAVQVEDSEDELHMAGMEVDE